MARTLNSIEMDFANAKRQADHLEQTAREMEKLLDGPFDSCMDTVSRNWKGENAAAYIGKGKIVRENIAHLARKIRDAAGVIRQIAQRTYETEMKAYRIAQMRTYQNL